MTNEIKRKKAGLSTGKGKESFENRRLGFLFS